MRTLLALSLMAGVANAQVIKLGTLAPNGSPWHQLLKEMGQKWSEVSGGKVTLKIYPGGTLGNEGDLVKKMRIGQLQAVGITTVGLHEIAPEPQAIDLPMVIDSWETHDYVMEKVAPKIEKALEAKGYVVLNWSDVGFVRFFSTKKLGSIKEVQASKLFCWEGDPGSAEAWKAGGFKTVLLSSTDIVPSLQTGMIETVALAPLYAYTSRMFERAKYMVDMPWAVLTGASVVRKDVWDKIPADVRQKLLEISHSYEKRIADEIRKMDAEALINMKQQGLELVKPSDAQEFVKAADAANKVIRGKVVPEALFDEVVKLAAEAKARKK